MNRNTNSITLEELKKEAIKKIAITVMCFVLAGILYYIFIRITGLSMPCIIYEITGMKCPGCGSTRMCMHLIKFQFRDAFNDNAYMLCCGPFIIADIIYIAYKDLINQKTGIKTLIFSGILIGIGVVFCIIRNI